MKNVLLSIVLFFAVFQISAQVKVKRMLPGENIFKETMEELGSPLKGQPVMIIQAFSTNTGSFLWFLNESEASNPSYLYDSPRDLHAGIYLEDHGGLIEKVRFKDFAMHLSQPEYLLDYCVVEDQDKDGYPEFYLTYMMYSDGLDAKPLKVIVYSTDGQKGFQKAKLIAWIPYQPEDQYREEQDSNYKRLPKAIQQRAAQLIQQAQKAKEL